MRNKGGAILEGLFEKLDAKKQKNILKAAYTEFASEGYEHASTNTIVKNAGIGKGTLFYYFHSKLELFQYLIDQAVEITFDKYLNQIDYTETDIFKRLIQIGNLKQTVLQQFEEPVTFLVHVLLHLNEYTFLPERLQETRLEIETYTNDILKRNIDYSKFKEEIPADKAVQLINWSIEGYSAELEKDVKLKKAGHFTQQEIEDYYVEFYEYIHILQKVYYKKEYVDENIFNNGGK